MSKHKMEDKKRIEIEKDLLKRDKQSLISDILKMVDDVDRMKGTGEMLLEQRARLTEELREAKLDLQIIKKLPRWKLFLRRWKG